MESTHTCNRFNAVTEEYVNQNRIILRLSLFTAISGNRSHVWLVNDKIKNTYIKSDVTLFRNDAVDQK